MRSCPGSFHLSFLLPKQIIFRPAIDGAFAFPECNFRFAAHPLVKIFGPTREAVFAAATGFLQSLARVPGPLSIAATVVSPPPLSGSDGWSIILGADIAFAPTSLGAEFPAGGHGELV